MSDDRRWQLWTVVVIIAMLTAILTPTLLIESRIDSPADVGERYGIAGDAWYEIQGLERTTSLDGRVGGFLFVDGSMTTSQKLVFSVRFGERIAVLKIDFEDIDFIPDGTYPPQVNFVFTDQGITAAVSPENGYTTAEAIYAITELITIRLDERVFNQQVQPYLTAPSG